MIDIETMGNKSNAVILSVSACYFDPKTGDIGDKFDKQINLQSSINACRDIDASTLIWWMDQEDTARKQFKNSLRAPKMSDVLKEFGEFIKKGSLVWGNGASFDLTILSTAFAKCRLPLPWDFWNERDVRTIVHLGKELGFDPKKDMPFVGVRHNALDDSIHQSKYVSAIWKMITKKD
jgi:hypothetical protein